MTHSTVAARPVSAIAEPLSAATCRSTRDVAEYQFMLREAALALEVSSPSAADFEGAMHAFAVEDLAIMRVASNAQDVVRSRASIRDFPTDAVKVVIERTGTAGVQQRERCSVLQPGFMTLYDTARPYEVHQFETFTADALLVPRDRLPIHDELFDAVQRYPIDVSHGAGAVFDGYLMSLWSRLPECTEAAASRLLSVLVELLAAALMDVPATEAMSTSALHTIAIQWIDHHLSDADLNPAAVAAATGISLRRLHRLFANSGVTVAAYIRGERLRRIKQDLENPRHRYRTAAAIGATWGIPDPTHLSRLFRAHFGLTPRDIRRVGATLDR